MHYKLVAAIFILATQAGIRAQQSSADNLPPETSVVGHLESYKTSLARNHISADYLSLIGALQNKDPRIRSDAAGELAEARMIQALSAMEAALARESVAQTRVNIAAAIGQLDGERGKTELFGLCQNESISDPARLDAARHLGDLKDARCLSYIESIARQTQYADVRVLALSLVPQLARTFPDQRAGVVEFLTPFLNDPAPSVRTVACESLEFAEGAAAIPSLRGRLAVEGNSDVIDQIHRSLGRLN